MKSQDGKVKKIVILGGGSAGWMTASYLNKALPDLNITLVESSDIPIIGVGEATIAHLVQFLLFLGLKEQDWMPACNASYKYAIRFDNWHEKGDKYWHPFEPIPVFQGKKDLPFSGGTTASIIIQSAAETACIVTVL